MKKPFDPRLLTGICAFLGAVCLALQQWLLGSTDKKGLLPADHPSVLLCGILVLAAAAVIGYSLWGKAHRFVYPPVPLSGIGLLISAAGFACTAWFLLRSKSSGFLEILCAVTAAVSALCAAARGVLHLQKKRPSPLLCCPVVFFFLLFLLSQYRHWSAEPELLRYIFSLGAHVSIMLYAYYRAAAEAGLEKSKACLITGCLGIFFCIACAAALPLFYIPMAMHLLLDSWSAVKRRPRPTPED